MHIGNIKLDNIIFLAPMAGYTDSSFRLICKEFGCGMVYSEMISAKGIYYKNENTANLSIIDDRERPAAIQIFGREPNIMAYAAAKLEEKGADLIDINMGCPTPKIVNNGDGCALMKEPELAGKIVEAVAKAVRIPVTVKIRKGWDDENINAVLFARLLEEKGAKAVAVHARTRSQFYSGRADWDIIKKIKEKIQIPVIGNGDISTSEDVLNMIKETNCDAVMIGRGALGNPWIFKHASVYLNCGRQIPETTPKIKIQMLIKHMDKAIKSKGEYIGIKEMRKHMIWYLKGLPNISKIKNQIINIDNKEKIDQLLKDYLNNFAD